MKGLINTICYSFREPHHRLREQPREWDRKRLNDGVLLFGQLPKISRPSYFTAPRLAPLSHFFGEEGWIDARKRGDVCAWYSFLLHSFLLLPLLALVLPRRDAEGWFANEKVIKTQRYACGLAIGKWQIVRFT
jgi:hypothetical protein